MAGKRKRIKRERPSVTVYEVIKTVKDPSEVSRNDRILIGKRANIAWRESEQNRPLEKIEEEQIFPVEGGGTVKETLTVCKYPSSFAGVIRDKAYKRFENKGKPRKKKK